MSNRPNYYRLLELDPAEQSWPTIERRIEELKQRFNRVRTDAPKDQQRAAEAFKIFLNHPEFGIARVMQDEVSRQAEAQARLQEVAAEEKQLQIRLRLLQSRGSYTDADVKEIAKDLTSLDGAKVEARLKQSGLAKDNVAGTKPQPTPARPQLAEADVMTIQADLSGLHLDSLYAFLENGVNPRSSQTALEDANQKQKSTIEKLVRGSPEHKVRSALLGQVKKFLLDDLVLREKYNNYLADRDLRALDTLIKLAGGTEKTITEESLDQIIRIAEIPNVTADRIREYVVAWVEKTKGWSLRVGPANPALPLLTCGFCGKRAQDAGQPKCTQCGRPLKIACPNPSCTQTVPTEDECCTKCGYHTGDAPRVEQLLSCAEKELQGRLFRAAKPFLQEALRLWPNYARAERLLQDVDKALQSETDKRQTLSRLIQERKLYAAQRLAEELQVAGCPVDASVFKQISDGKSAARAAFTESSEFGRRGKQNESWDRLLSALDQCADDPQAVQAIPPPVQFTVKCERKCNQLKWQSSFKRPGAKFIVCRKEGGRPTHSADGEVLATTAGEFFDDSTAGTGRVWFYAVFTVWRESCSITGACSQPVLFPGSVTNLTATGADGVVRLSWTQPRGCREIQIERNDAPKRVVRASELVDSGLTIGKTYTYRLMALYEDPNRGLAPLASPPETISVDVTKRPTPVTDFQAVVTGNRVRLQWTPPTVGQLEIRQSERLPTAGLHSGMYLDVAAAQSLGDPLPHLGRDSAEIALTTSNQCYLIPITVAGSTAVVGAWRHIVNLPEVSNFTSRPLARGKVELTWDWPAGVDVVRIVVSPVSGSATTGTAAAETTEEVSRQRFFENGSVWRVTCSREEPYTITVATKSAHGGLYSSGVNRTETLGHEMRIHYHVECGWKTLFTGGGARIELRAESQGCDQLDRIVVVGLADRLPTRIDDGEIVQEAALVIFANGRATVPLEARNLVRPLYLKLFLREPQRYPGLRLLPAAKDRLILKR